MLGMMENENVHNITIVKCALTHTVKNGGLAKRKKQ
jgi:hypothetical protein